MNSFLIVDDEDMRFIWDTIQEQQIIFHHEIAPDGRINLDKFRIYQRNKPFTLLIDRNILSALIKFCENGYLKDKGESQLIGLIMVWAEMNDIAVSAGLAVREYATQIQSNEAGLIELDKFLKIFKEYPGQLWLRVAEGIITKIPPISYTNGLAENITVDYASGDYHYDMAVASLLHVVRLYRERTMKPVDKVRDFFQWTYDNLLVGEYLLVYVTLLFSGQEHIKAPKNANSDNIDKIVAGCKNQAWDISYLTNLSTFYKGTENNNNEFLFATNDVLLKRIFINANSPYGLNGLLYEVFPKKDYTMLMNFMEEKMSERIKPDFGENPHAYFMKLIEEEKQQLLFLIQNNDC